MTTTLLEASHVTKDFIVRKSLMGRPVQTLRAVDQVSFALDPGETLGVVGESGCGKTTLARLVLRLLQPSGGTIRFDGRDVTGLAESELRPLRRYLQVVFQDPYSSLNPRSRVRSIVAEPLRNFGFTRHQVTARVADVLEIVGLPPDAMERYPHAFSGGQRQRIGIARALALQPKLIVCDEAVSALDVSIQAQILNLLADIQRRFHLALLFISHNLAVVRHVSHRIAVMYLGQLVELASQDDLFARPAHPYTNALISAVPEPTPPAAGANATTPPLEGELPNPLSPPSGCYFHTRCPIATDECRAVAPPFREYKPGRWVRCHFPERIAEKQAALQPKPIPRG